MATIKTIPKCSLCGHKIVVETTVKRDKKHEAYLVKVAIDLLNSRTHFDF